MNELFEINVEQQPMFTEPEKKQNPWLTRFTGVLIIISFWIVQFLAAVLMVVFLTAHGNLGAIESAQDLSGPMQDMFLGMMVAELLMIIILVIIYNKRIWNKTKDALSQPVEFLLKIAGYFGLLWVVTIVFSIVDSTLFPQLISEAGDNQELIETALATPSLPMIISICITAPIVEEFVFRFGIISKLLYGVNKYVAAVIAALIFSFAHIGFSQMTSLPLFIHLMIGYLGQALVFSFIYAKEDNLIYSIAIHILNNLQAVILIVVIANLG